MATLKLGVRDLGIFWVGGQISKDFGPPPLSCLPVAELVSKTSWGKALPEMLNATHGN